MLQDSMQYPPHVTQLLRDLQSYSEASDVLLRHADYVTQDTSLYHIYVSLGYNPEAGNFYTSPSNQDAIQLLKSEYKDLFVNELSELKVFHADSSQEWGLSKGMKGEFLRTYLENCLHEYADPSEIGLEESTMDYEESSSEQKDSTPVWVDSSPVKTPQKLKSFTPSPFSKRSNHTPRSDKGLKNLSVRVQHIVCQRQHTSYKQVADDLIKELEVSLEYDNEKEEKNIRRRVYDALNVLVAADVVKKSGKTISWNHVSPDRSSTDETSNYHIKSEQRHRIFTKRQMLKDLHNKSLALQALIHRNKCTQIDTEAIPFPFIIAATCDSPSNSVNVDINPTNTEVCIKFVHEITLFGDLDILLKMDLHKQNVSLVPEELNELIYRADEKPKIMKLLDDSF